MRLYLSRSCYYFSWFTSVLYSVIDSVPGVSKALFSFSRAYFFDPVKFFGVRQKRQSQNNAFPLNTSTCYADIREQCFFQQCQARMAQPERPGTWIAGGSALHWSVYRATSWRITLCLCRGRRLEASASRLLRAGGTLSIFIDMFPPMCGVEVILSPQSYDRVIRSPHGIWPSCTSHGNPFAEEPRNVQPAKSNGRTSR